MPLYWVRRVRHTNGSNPDALAERKTKQLKKIIENIMQKKTRGVVPPRRCGRLNRTAVRENRVRPRAKGKDRETEAQQKYLTGQPQPFVVGVAQ